MGSERAFDVGSQIPMRGRRKRCKLHKLGPRLHKKGCLMQGARFRFVEEEKDFRKLGSCLHKRALGVGNEISICGTHKKRVSFVSWVLVCIQGDVR